MDLLAHTVYGATVCSQSGVAGGVKGAGRRWFKDWTLWASVGFSLVPDAVSMGFPLLFFLFDGTPGNFFRAMDPDAMVHYHYAHSLITALLVSAVLYLVFRPLFLPSLAWPLHLISDALTHGAGKYQTMLLYPLWEWKFPGVSWWRHPGVVLLYWMIPPVIWVVLAVLRRSKRRKP